MSRSSLVTKPYVYNLTQVNAWYLHQYDNKWKSIEYKKTYIFNILTCFLYTTLEEVIYWYFFTPQNPVRNPESYHIHTLKKKRKMKAGFVNTH